MCPRYTYTSHRQIKSCVPKSLTAANGIGRWRVEDPRWGNPSLSIRTARAQPLKLNHQRHCPTAGQEQARDIPLTNHIGWNSCSRCHSSADAREIERDLPNRTSCSRVADGAHSNDRTEPHFPPHGDLPGTSESAQIAIASRHTGLNMQGTCVSNKPPDLCRHAVR